MNMSIPERRNLRITGTSTGAGGTYNQVRIVGDSKIIGDVDCITFSCTGNIEVTGNYISKMFRATGNANFAKNMTQDKMKITGEAQVHENAKIIDGKITGQLTVAGHLTGVEVQLYGQLDVKGNCEVDQLRGIGAIQVQGLLNTGKLHLQLYGPSTASEIGGEQITVIKPSGITGFMKSIAAMFSSAPEPRLTADLIEGDDITLEYTHAKVVRGNRVTIGKFCIIDEVEYRESYTQSPDATVNHCVQIGRGGQ